MGSHGGTPPLGTGNSAETANATTNFTASHTLAALNIGGGVVVTFGYGPEATPGIGAPVVPEPGSVGLLMVGALGLLGRRRDRMTGGVPTRGT